MSFRKPCHIPFRKLIPPFTLTESCSGIRLHKLCFVFSPTVEKAHVGRKIALASVHRLAEHLHAMSTQKSRYKISDYSQARSSVPPKIPLMYFLFES